MLESVAMKSINSAADRSPRLNYVSCSHPGGLHRVAYWEWGDPENSRVVLCAHGLTRTGRDFDALAEALANDFRVIALDAPGRGRSDWLTNPMHYDIVQYVADCVTLIARLNVSSLDWVGTSMGGLMGMLYCATPGNLVRRLVLNDIGPIIAEAGRVRISTYVGGMPEFESYEQGRDLMISLSASFGPHDAKGWEIFCRHYIVEKSVDGRRFWGFHYDPNISVAFRSTAGQPVAPLWPYYEALQCPTLVVRGAESDILDAETFAAMQVRGPRAQGAQFAGVGHAPTLIAADQIRVVRDFLILPKRTL
jgi:pimeloyl-ACP methyl ester carboxylesterase